MNSKSPLVIGPMTTADYAAIAEMWNSSLDGWNGMFARQTEETVKSMVASFGGLDSVTLARQGDDVVGFCNLESCPWEPAMQFIPLLNVRSDVRGQGVGRHLLRRVVEKAVATRDPVLLLFTWPGNTRAVPLYKRTGFFWEPNDGSTKLVNFLPFVLNTPAFAPYFQKADWLDALRREREVKPDGTKIDGLTVYEYLFDCDAGRLRLQFDKQGYGLRLVETESFEISLSLDKVELVAGLSYSVRLHILNKSQRALAFQVTLSGEEHVRASGDTVFEVDAGQALTRDLPFEISPFSEPLPHAKKRSGLRVVARVDDMALPLKVGLDARPAFTLRGVPSSDDLSLVAPSAPSIEVTSALDVPVRVTIPLSSSEIITFSANEIACEIPARGTVFRDLPVTAARGGLHTHRALVNATLPDGKSMTIEHDVAIPVVRWNSLFAGRVDGTWLLNAGAVTLQADHPDIGTSVKGTPTSTGLDFPPPEHGERSSTEFGGIEPVREWVEQGSHWVAYHRRMASREQPGLEVVETLRLYANGLIERYLEVENHAKEPIATCMRLRTYMDPSHAVFARQGALVEVSGTPRPGNAGAFELHPLDENWLYFQGTRLGLTWESPWEFEIPSHGLSLVWNPGEIPPGGSRCSPRLYAGSFVSAEALRSFALGSRSRARPVRGSTLQLRVNEGNPVLTGPTVPFALACHELLEAEGKVVGSLGTSEKTLAPRETLTFGTPQETVAFARARGDFPDRKVDLAQVLLVPRGEVSVQEVDGSWSCDNGALTFRASEGFAPAIHSLRRGCTEWLHSSHPGYSAFGRWNPFFGGLFFCPSQLLMDPLLKEPRSVSVSTLPDSHGNLWKGLRCRVVFQESEKLRGAAFSLHALTLPGVPCLWLVPEVEGGERTLDDLYCGLTAFLTFPNPEERVRLAFRDGMGHERAVGHTASARNFRAQGLLEASLPGVDEKLFVAVQPGVAHLHMAASMHASQVGTAHQVTLRSGTRVFLPPAVLLFSGEPVSSEALEPLLALRPHV